jgi:hypothetical protein
MNATKEQIVAEAERRWEHDPVSRDWSVTDYIIQVVREGWRPPVDPDLLAVQEVLRETHPEIAVAWGNKTALWTAEYAAQAILAAYKAGREAEAERAKVLVEPAEAIVNRAVKGTGANDIRWSHILKAAGRLDQGLKAYKAGKEAAQ